MLRDCPVERRRRQRLREKRRLRGVIRRGAMSKVRRRLHRHQRRAETYMRPRDRARLLAFAVKESLLHVTNWSDEARSMSLNLERTRQALIRHHHI